MAEQTEPFTARFEFVCEACDKTETLTNDEAFHAGWDYPPFIGSWGIVSPRTCPDCLINMTLWWALAAEGRTPDQLTEKQTQTLARILAEEPRGE